MLDSDFKFSVLLKLFGSKLLRVGACATRGDCRSFKASQRALKAPWRFGG